MTNKKSAGTAKKTVKTAGRKVRDSRDIPRYFSHRDTPPIDVYNEQGMIIEGYHPPFQYKNETKLKTDGTVRQVGRFEKTAKERSDWEKASRGGKGPRGGLVSRRNELKSPLIIHFKNVARKKDFPTTRKFEVTASEVAVLIGKLHTPDHNKIVQKYYYKGQCFIHVSEKVN